MAEFRLPYGHHELTAALPDHLPVELVAPRSVEPVSNPQFAVEQALDAPLDAHSLAGFSGVRAAAIAINDKTRPVPHRHLLPPLLARLEGLGLEPEAITLVIATGTHAPMQPDEYPAILPPEIIARYPVICHDANDRDSLARLGETRRGTPVWLNRRFVEADLRIVVGNIEPHQFMGFSGGVKSAVIGLGGRETINTNHAWMADPLAQLGRYADNPARQDVEEMGRLAGIHFALNAVLNDRKEIVHVLAGEPEAVMAAGIPLVRDTYQVEVREPFDLLIVSPGGHPKDINVYQAQKALGHAALVSKPGGAIVLAAACPEGSGSAGYEHWVAGIDSHEAVIERFRREGYRIGPHKAFQIARDTLGRRVQWVTDMPFALTRRLLLDKAASLDEALAAALAQLPAGGRIGIIPVANATIPRLASGA